jgi:hypothetical protein
MRVSSTLPSSACSDFQEERQMDFLALTILSIAGFASAGFASACGSLAFKQANSVQHNPEHVQTLRFLGVNLCEPLINIILVIGWICLLGNIG